MESFIWQVVILPTILKGCRVLLMTCLEELASFPIRNRVLAAPSSRSSLLDYLENEE